MEVDTVTSVFMMCSTHAMCTTSLKGTLLRTVQTGTATLKGTCAENNTTQGRPYLVVHMCTEAKLRMCNSEQHLLRSQKHPCCCYA